MLVKKIILIILALGAVGTLSFFLLNKNSLPEVTQQVGMEKENLDDQWLTYTNDSYQYEIKYHRDWHKQEENEPPYPPPPAGMNFSRRWLEPLEVCDFQISSSDIVDNFEGEIESLSQDTNKQMSQAVIAGQKATKFVSSTENQLVESYYLTYKRNSFSLGFNILRGEHFNTCQQVFNQMIASFKLL
ncbi:hypothetical protein A2Z41_03860 [Microgenomates group bacterium RBG_19FT_COMBO_39_10]|nr:MAG: hypothetical protein A2Z41_03860 [Microgenomates group bacterium RBG_19FT_COMBO_39_10]